jgi:hypothetical protein
LFASVFPFDIKASAVCNQLAKDAQQVAYLSEDGEKGHGEMFSFLSGSRSYLSESCFLITQ